MLPATESENLETMQTELESGTPAETVPNISMTVTRDSPEPRILAPLVIATSRLKQENDSIDPLPCQFEKTVIPDAELPPKVSSPPRSSIIQHQSVSQSQTDAINKFHEQSSNESVRSWLQRITAMQYDVQHKHKPPPPPPTDYQQHTKLQNMPGCTQSLGHTSRVVKYQDLPYMGEMTLDNSKPRRGRKPKKADICHLIYKNYGTIFPGTPKSFVGTQNELKRSAKAQKVQISNEPVQRTNVQNKIISSLLEKRLTQESLRNKENLLKHVQETKAHDQDEPLNLCIRDLNQLKIRLLRKHGNVYASDPSVRQVKAEPLSDDEVEFVPESPSPESIVKLPEASPFSETDSSSTAIESKTADLPGGYVYWPNAGVFIHPMALHSQFMYYQRMAANNNVAVPATPGSVQTTISPVPLLDSPVESDLKKLVLKPSVVQLDKPQEHELISGPIDSRLKRVAAQGSSTPTKRKRSAIFIPPIPAENQTNPATEVSICKFKFTGGAKPSLQEKKMLSVDSGGNFRYYSGTGDKSMRGYEFFPREALQQQAAAGSSHGSGTGAFLQASGEKMSILPPPGDQKPGRPDFMFNQETSLQTIAREPDLATTTRHRKRKTRKSLQREKLEQTFKEKGFLIQTQQLESAEGATYCKFRQLRKFTRYLFRSWKDYLPGNVQDLQNGEKSDEEDPEAIEIADLTDSTRVNPSDLTDM